MTQNKKATLTFDEAQLVFSYDPESGFLNWKRAYRDFKPGEQVGKPDKNGYLVFSYCGVSYYVHRIAWLLYYGYLPEGSVSHLDSVNSNNPIENLIEGSQSCIMRKAKLAPTKTGVRGVFWIDRHRCWSAQIKSDSKKSFLGHFSDFAEAVCCRLAAEQCFDWDLTAGETSAEKYVAKYVQHRRRRPK